MKIPFGDIDPSIAEHIRWVQMHRDPELWHAVVMAIVNSYGTDSLEFSPWVFAQPETDRSTAGYFFLGLAGPSFLKTGNYPYKGGECLSEEAFLLAVAALKMKCLSGGFEHDNIGLPMSDEHRTACLELFNKGEVMGENLPFVNMLAQPFPAARITAYEVEDGLVYN